MTPRKAIFVLNIVNGQHNSYTYFSSLTLQGRSYLEQKPKTAYGKWNHDKELKLLIGLLISCTLFDWFAINSGVWCVKDRGWRQPWSLWIPYTHLEGEGGRHRYSVVNLAQDFSLILSSSFVESLRHGVWSHTF